MSLADADAVGLEGRAKVPRSPDSGRGTTSPGVSTGEGRGRHLDESEWVLLDETSAPPPAAADPDVAAPYAKINAGRATVENTPLELVAAAQAAWAPDRQRLDRLRAAEAGANGRADREAAHAAVLAARTAVRDRLQSARAAARAAIDAATAAAAAAAAAPPPTELSALKRELVLHRLGLQLLQQYWEGYAPPWRNTTAPGPRPVESGGAEGSGGTPGCRDTGLGSAIQATAPCPTGTQCPACRARFETEESMDSHFRDEHPELKRVEQGPGQYADRSLDATSFRRKMAAAFGTAGDGGGAMGVGAAAASRDDVTEDSAQGAIVWPPQKIGITRRLGATFQCSREEFRGMALGGPPRFIQTLERLLYGQPPGVSRKDFEQRVVKWAADTAAARCKECGVALTSKLVGGLGALGALGSILGGGRTQPKAGDGSKGALKACARHHCRICGKTVCDAHSSQLLAGGADGAAGIVHTCRVRARLAAFGKGGVTVAADGGGDAAAAADAEARLAIVGEAMQPPRRTEAIRVCAGCEGLIAEFHGREKQWVAFVDTWLCDQLFPLPVVRVQHSLSAKLARFADLAAELAELTACLYHGEALRQYDHAVALRAEYQAALKDVNAARDAFGKVRPRDGSGDATLITRIRGAVLAMLLEVKSTVPELPSREQVTLAADARRAAIRSLAAGSLALTTGDTVAFLEVWENQRVGIGGWKPTTKAGQLINDAQPWETKGRAERKIFEQGRGFTALDDVVPLPGDRFIPGSQWVLSPRPDTDDDGWEYSASFGPITPWARVERGIYSCRRRLWVRPVEMDGLGGPSGGGGAGVEGNAKWMPDTDVDVCTLCRATRFNVLVRRHHCRFCGAVVCDGCSHGRKYSEAAGEPVRCCDRCIAVRPAPLAPPAASADTDNDGTSGAPTEVTTCEVFENQRNIAGWRKTVPPDRAPFTELGTHREYKYLEAVKPPPGFVWDADEWFVRTGPGVDADGWEYAGVRWDSGFIAFSGTYSMLKHATRRRALTRKCRRIEGITWPRAIVGECVNFPVARPASAWLFAGRLL